MMCYTDIKLEKDIGGRMEELTKLIKDDMKPALGVTEPGAIAYAVATAKSYTMGQVKRVTVSMSSGLYKNAFTCGIPGSPYVGNLYAAALGVVAGDEKLGLLALKNVTKEDNEEAKRLVDEGIISINLTGIDSAIYLEAEVETVTDYAVVTIKGSHTNIVKIVVNHETIFKDDDEEEETQNLSEPVIHNYTLGEILDYVNKVDVDEIAFIEEAYKMNYELFEESLLSDKTTFAPSLLEMNGGVIISRDEQASASLLCNATIEGRVIGLDKPAMSITGSGAHGIIATMPLYGAYKVNNYSKEMLFRATALSYLVCMYIKEYSGKLSAFCGCAIAAGTGMACGLTYLRDGGINEMTHVIDNMASSITGMICDGGNEGCTMKGIAAVDVAYKSVAFAMKNVYVDKVHGINGDTPEKTMRNMGLIASPGMAETEKTILEIFENKLK